MKSNFTITPLKQIVNLSRPCCNILNFNVAHFFYTQSFFWGGGYPFSHHTSPLEPLHGTALHWTKRTSWLLQVFFEHGKLNPPLKSIQICSEVYAITPPLNCVAYTEWALYHLHLWSYFPAPEISLLQPSSQNPRIAPEIILPSCIPEQDLIW